MMERTYEAGLLFAFPTRGALDYGGADLFQLDLDRRYRGLESCRAKRRDAIGGFGLIGLWALLNSVMGLSDHALPKALAWMGILLGVTPTLALLAVFRANSVANALNGMAGQTAAGGQTNPMVYVLFMLGFISYAGLPIWFILIGRLFLSDRALISVTSAAG